MIEITIETIIFDSLILLGVGGLTTYLFMKYRTIKGILKNVTDWYGMEDTQKAGVKNFQSEIYKKGN